MSAFELGGSSGGSAAPDLILDQFGTPDTAFEFDTSSLAGLTAIGSPTVEDADTTVDGCYYVRRDPTGSTVQPYGRYISAPSAPWTAFVKLNDTNMAQDAQRVILFHARSNAGTPDNLFLSQIVMGTGDLPASASCQYFPTQTTTDAFLGTTFNDVLRKESCILAIRCNSATDVDYLFSFDGRIWYTIENARNPTVAQNFIGFGIVTGPAVGLTVEASFEYFRVYLSALTLVGSA